MSGRLLVTKINREHQLAVARRPPRSYIVALTTDTSFALHGEK